MESLLLVFLVFGAILNIEAQKCPTSASLQNKAINNNGVTYRLPAGKVYSTQDDDNCYIVLLDEPRSWLESKDICHFMANSLDIIAEQQGQMATIKSAEKQNAVESMLNQLWNNGTLGSNDRFWLGSQLVSDVQDVKASGFGKNTDYNVLRATARGPSTAWLTDRPNKPDFNIDPRLMAIQGCFWDTNTASINTMLIPYAQLPASYVTPESCMKECERNQRPYWAVRVENTGPRCLCLFGGYAQDPDGNGPYDPVTGTNNILFPNQVGNANFYCNVPCTNDTNKICGGRQVTDPNANAVYQKYPQLVGVVNGVNSTLRYGWQQPDYAGRNEYYFVLDMESWRLEDTAIYNNQFTKYPVICEIECRDGSQPLGSTGKCVYISSSNSDNYMTYFEAKKTCRDLGGDIIFLQFESEWKALRDLYKQMVDQNLASYKTSFNYPVRYIIGQTGRELLWVDCDAERKDCEYENEYTNFDARQPGRGEYCINMFVNPTGQRFTWETAKCETEKFSLCEIALRQDNINQCESNPCGNNGACEDLYLRYTCRCQQGWAGTDCEINVDECSPTNPCQNGGKCVDGIASYSCNCATGWGGQDCTANIDSCAGENPCRNGGTCADQVQGYTCTCASGFSGPDCSNNINDCPLFPTCLNGATCVDGVNSRQCRCANGFNGDRCQNNTDECTLHPCSNGGTCIDGNNTRTCKCVPGLTGDSCETNIDDCTNSSCQNGGTCTDGLNSVTCQCADGWSGDSCTVNENLCSGITCQNGGTCTTVGNTPTCTCAPGWSGNNCQDNINECIPDPCKNGATCNDGIAKATCTCVPGWNGTDCGQNIDDCVKNPCKNGGTCNDGVNSFSCQCASGWMGDDCQVRISTCSVTPCQNGGTCTDNASSGTSSCQCAPGWSGERCGANVDECASKPCLNNATCTDGTNSFSCQCATGWTGDNCGTQEAVSCTPNPCRNSGLCNLVSGIVECTCVGNWEGARCEVDVGQSTVATGLSNFEIALIIILVIIFLIILIALILFCCYKKKDKKRRKQINAYDARPNAPVPYSGQLGEEIYLAESDKAGLFADPSVFRTSSESQNYHSARSPRVHIENHNDYDINQS